MTDSTNTPERTQESWLKLRLDLLFSTYIETEPKEAIETIGDYYAYLAEHIDYKAYALEIEQPLLDPFEAVSLVLEERLQPYPEAICRQVKDVFQEAKLLRTFGLVANLGTQDIRKLRRRTGVFKYLNQATAFFGISFGPPADYGITQELLLETRLALKRISQILKYAATLEVISYEQAFEDIRPHYDPELLNKNKLLALINILQVEVAAFKDPAVQSLVLGKLERIEEELRKPRPKWGTVITWCFVLFSFVSDLKSVAPQVYDRAYQILGQVINVLHTEGGVNSSKAPLPLNDRSPAVIPEISGTIIKRDEDEDIDSE